MAKVFIHFGPPKTGTSAIQKWLLENRDVLKTKRIYYPEHGTDKNGISSGNAMSIFKNPKDDKLKQARPNKLKLKEQCRENNCNTLLLSSEMFMRKLPELATLFPNAQFIGYIRPPFELLESDYNQVVKRHGETKLFSENSRSAMWQLDMLRPLINDIGVERFTLRAYSPSAYVGQSLVKDFLHTLNPALSDLAEIDAVKGVNPSYTLEALEIRRWLNQFDIEPNIGRQIDKHLQSISTGTRSYSLIPVDEFAAHKQSSIDALTAFNDDYPIESFDSLIEDITNKKQQNYYEQTLTNVDFTQIVTSIIKSIPESKAAFANLKGKISGQMFSTERINLIEELIK